MAEIVDLEKFRKARAIVAARAQAQKWSGLRFKDIDYLDYFQIPSVAGGKGDIYLKVEEDLAAVWSTLGDSPHYLLLGENESSFNFNFDMPILACDFELVPPG